MTQANLILSTDSYKLTHWKQYPPGTEKVYSYFESRGGPSEEIVFYGIQALIKKYFAGVRVTLNNISEARRIVDKHLGAGFFNVDGWLHILRDHGGTLPVEIAAIPEGSVVTPRTTMFTIENTCPKCFWLTNYLETLLVELWYPSTVATYSRECKKVILEYLNATGDPSTIDFKLHDFGFRGVSSPESAAIGGSAHLINFRGTDTLVALTHIQEYYEDSTYMAGFSVAAAEHSTITSWEEGAEVLAYKNMLTQFPTGIVAVVSDSYDIMNAVNNLWGFVLRSDVMGREGTLVIRPDSGDPVRVAVDVVEACMDRFGYTMNEKGYRVLPPQVRVIYGDGINLGTIGAILKIFMVSGLSADNIGFGMGGALLQQCNRDTYNFAMKAAEVTVNGVARDVHKKPVGDSMKASTGGRKTGLTPIFRDGKLLLETTFDEIRERAKIKP